MADPINFDPYLGWVDITDPNNIPPDARVIGADDLLRYENFAIAAAALLNELAASSADYRLLAKNPDTIINSVSRVNGVVSTATVIWPDGTPGIYTPTYDPSGAISSYTITYGAPVLRTYTQPTITRDASGAATTIPQIVVS